MEKITSTTNEIVKKAAGLALKKYREETGLFLAEGEKAINGLFNSGYEIVELFVKAENIRMNAKKMYLVNDAILNKLSTTKTPCPQVAVVKQRAYNKNEILKQKRLLLLENIKDAGNFGTILRSCKAFEIDAVLLLGNTIDLYNPKVVRASVGCFDLPVINISYDDLSSLKELNVYSTALYENSIPLNEVEFKEPFVIAFGSEADGLTDEFLKRTNFVNTKNIKIETSAQVESLNLASAVSICLYKSNIAI